jgi:hypothetical protein
MKPFFMKWIYLLFIICTPVFIEAQSFINLSKENFVYRNNYQFSSLVVYNNRLLLPTERCDSLIMLDLQGNYISGKKLGLPGTQLEGASLYQQYLLLVDETKSNPSVHFYDLEKSKTTCSVRVDFSYNDDKYGIEGIAVNVATSTCYILQERNENSRSVIKQFKILPKGEGCFELIYKQGSDLFFEHSKYSESLTRRYTDLFFFKNSLYLLGSHFLDTTHRANQYFIDSISGMDEAGYFKPRNLINGEHHVYADLSRTMRIYFGNRKDERRNSTNLEGFTFHGDEIYLVTDNWQGGYDCGKSVRFTTLLLKLMIPGG